MTSLERRRFQIILRAARRFAYTYMVSRRFAESDSLDREDFFLFRGENRLCHIRLERFRREEPSARSSIIAMKGDILKEKPPARAIFASFSLILLYASIYSLLFLFFFLFFPFMRSTIFTATKRYEIDASYVFIVVLPSSIITPLPRFSSL